ncbi:hypothetical protein ACEZDB_23375 [Streptacidiphilus sp. N1-3]|uniref:Uncharacterized protein n=1 Tax=Streptacidiphilus alkalitolerans TaxID=3342712 RepID=A0ABV6X605_9ACTN
MTITYIHLSDHMASRFIFFVVKQLLYSERRFTALPLIRVKCKVPATDAGFRSRNRRTKGASPVKRVLSIIIALAAMMVGFVAVGPSSASASGYGCSGNLVTTRYIGSIGETYIYWDGTYDCAVTVDNAKNAKNIYIDLIECTGDVSQTACPEAASKVDGDTELYHWYAGPVKVYGVHHCIQLVAIITTTDGSKQADVDGTGFDCG